ncbi:MAG TPA: DUF192 domain-containing protein [Patescibacteria group bacterium]|nr:DUF192 domain-containing protein [Patescibacteria group bacterium]
MKKLLISLLAFAGFMSAENRFITIFIQDKPFFTEIADTPEKQTRGLMFRTRLRADYGMLFVFGEEDIRSFWMKNTLIPLDIIYLNSERQIVDMYCSVPPCRSDPCPGYISALPARYVLEIAGGSAKKLKLQIGDKIFIPID